MSDTVSITMSSADRAELMFILGYATSTADKQQKPDLVKRIMRITFLISQDAVGLYDPNYGDDKLCSCGHPYYRHFDTYDNMAPVGCKYCGSQCPGFRQETK